MKRVKSLVLILLVLSSVMAFDVVQAEEKPPEQVLFTNVNIFDGKNEKLQQGMNVLIEDNLIKTISKDAKATSPTATVIDGAGRTLMPGLIDMHTHLALKRAISEIESLWDGQALGAMASETMHQYLKMGYTTIRDICGGMQGVARAVQMGAVTGPRIYHGAACLSGTSGHADWDAQNAPRGRKSMAEELGIVSIANGPDEYRAATRWNFRNGATVTKLFVSGGVASNFDPLEAITATPEEIRAVVEATEDFGSYVCVHAFTDEGVVRALDNGVKCVEHGFLMKEETVKRMAKEGQVLSLQSYVGYEAFKAPEKIAGFTAEHIAKARKINENTDKVHECFPITV